MTLTVVELFAGIGGFSCGFEQAGAKTVAAVEIDPACRQLLSERYPNTVLFEDVTKVGGDDIRATGFASDRGVLTAGWPCQDISRAGQQRGLDGERSGLFSEVVRLLDDLQPRWFVLENVPRLLTINNGRDMGAVVGALVECGYGLAYRVLDASGFGVPQKRRRIFFVGCLGDTGERAAEILLDTNRVLGSAPQGREAGTQTSRRSSRGDGSGSQPVVHVSTLQGGGKRGYRIDAEGAAGGHLIVCPPEYGVRRLTPLECERLQGFPDNWTAGHKDASRYRMLGNAVAVPVVQWIAERLVQADGMMND